MAKINISFNNTNYQIPEASLSTASAALKSHLSNVMNGSGAVVTLDGVSYGVDATKLSAATTDFVNHLGNIAGNGHKVMIGGVEYGVDANKVAGAIGELGDVLSGLNSPEQTLGFPIRWNSMETSKDLSIQFGGGLLVRVSEFLPTAEDFAKTTLTHTDFYVGDSLVMEGQTHELCFTETFTGAAIYNYDDTGELMVLAVYEAGEIPELGVTAPDVGLYVVDYYGLTGANVDFIIDIISTPTEERLEGDGAEYYTLAPTALSFRSTAPLNELQEVLINGVTVDPSNYTLEEGSTIVTFPIEYLKTLDVGNYEVAVASDSKTVKGGFNVKAPELNEHGFYYNQPYVGYVQGYGNIALFYREDNILDFIIVDRRYVETATYSVSGNNITNNVSLGAIPAAIASDGIEIQCVALGTTFKLGDDSVIADEDYIYMYDADLNGYEVQCIDKTKTEYGAIKTGINGIDTVALGEGAFEGLNHTDKENPSKLYNIPRIPSSVVKIGLFCFRYCQNLTDVVIPNSIITIGDHAFASCVNLHSVIIADSVTTIGARAFGECGNLTSVTIGNSVTSVGDSAFYGCSSLASIVIPSSVTSIDGWVFYDCSSLASITFNGTTSQWNAITKGTYWNFNVPATYVQCSDGQVAL